jgi:flagellar protein FliL
MATAAPDAAAAPAGGGKKKLIMILGIVVVLVVVLGVAAVMLLKKKPAEGEDGEEMEAAPRMEVAAPKPGTPPVYLPVDPFTVNLADRDVDRYAQVAVTLEVVDQKTADLLKTYMPSIRSGVLMVLSAKTATELLSREGKEKLQQEILAEAVRPLGFEVEVEEAEDEEAPKKKRKKRRPQVLPVSTVLFAQLIVQ